MAALSANSLLIRFFSGKSTDRGQRWPAEQELVKSEPNGTATNNETLGEQVFKLTPQSNH